MIEKRISRSKERIMETGEVFTPPAITNEILDHLSEEMWEPHRTFLDPAAGEGHMIVEIYKRKIATGSTPTEALSTIYGIDIMRDNVLVCREKLLELAGNTDEYRDIVNFNIQKGDTLSFDWSRFDNRGPLIEF